MLTSCLLGKFNLCVLRYVPTDFSMVPASPSKVFLIADATGHLAVSLHTDKTTRHHVREHLFPKRKCIFLCNNRRCLGSIMKTNSLLFRTMLASLRTRTFRSDPRSSAILRYVIGTSC